ncbi:uncharacterized protein FYW61_002413 [Anableps anableps]
MKVLVLFAFVVLGCSLAGARKVTKCEMKQQLMAAFSSLPNNVTVNGLSEESFLAKVVCHVQQLSDFDTSAVTKLSRGMGKQSKEDSSESGSESGEQDKGKGKQRPSHKQGEQSNEDVDVTLYGLFQLPEGIVCSSDSKTSPNMCDISCNKLTDDDISDDISCVVKLINELVTKGFLAKNSRELWKVVKQLIEDKCQNLDQYFSEC